MGSHGRVLNGGVTWFAYVLSTMTAVLRTDWRGSRTVVPVRPPNLQAPGKSSWWLEQEYSGKGSKKWLDSGYILRWSLQNWLTPACGCVFRSYYTPFMNKPPFTPATLPFTCPLLGSPAMTTVKHVQYLTMSSYSLVPLSLCLSSTSYLE